MSDTKLREYLIRTRIYRFCAYIFIVFGIILFSFLYINQFHGDPSNVLKSPLVAIMLLFPFLPAAVLTWMASSTEKKMMELLESQGK